jgi:hypothetical protein
VDRVVLVPDEATFLQAISEWSLQGRWPILIEDDTYTPMFLRRFQAAEVIRLEATGDRLRDRPSLACRRCLSRRSRSTPRLS